MEVIDLRGLPIGDPQRENAYPQEPAPQLKPGYRHIFEPMQFIHLLSTRWYFDASEATNVAEADRVIGELVGAVDEFSGHEYQPYRVVVDNFGGTIVGRRQS